MSNKPYEGFEPKWLLTPAPEDSYRSIFRWGDPQFFKYPKESLYKMMKEVFKMTDDDFREYADDIGFDKVELKDHPVKLAKKHISEDTLYMNVEKIKSLVKSIKYGATE